MIINIHYYLVNIQSPMRKFYSEKYNVNLQHQNCPHIQNWWKVYGLPFTFTNLFDQELKDARREDWVVVKAEDDTHCSF